MPAFKKTAVILAMGLVGLAHAGRPAVWKVEGHITSIDVSADPAFADLWSRFRVGQDFVATFKVDLDAKSDFNAQFAYAPDSTLQFKEAGLSYRLSAIGDGITVGLGGLDLGYGYGAQQGGGAHSPGVAHAWHFDGKIPVSPRAEPPLWAANDAIRFGELSFRPVQFGFVGGEVGNLGTYIHASIDSVTTSVPEGDTVLMALAGGLPCTLVVSVMRRRNARRGLSRGPLIDQGSSTPSSLAAMVAPRPAT